MIKRLIIYFFALNNLLLAYTVSDATGQNGLVVSSKEQASQVGIDILKSGSLNNICFAK